MYPPSKLVSKYILHTLLHTCNRQTGQQLYTYDILH